MSSDVLCTRATYHPYASAFDTQLEIDSLAMAVWLVLSACPMLLLACQGWRF
jgi:hypothetical protein